MVGHMNKSLGKKGTPSDIRVAAMSLIWGFPELELYDSWLREASEAGYDGVTCFAQDISPLVKNGVLCAMLDRYGLDLAALDWRMGDDLGACRRYFDWMRDFGCSRFVCIDPATDGKDYRGLARRVNRVASMAQDYGIECFYHNHTAAVGETYGDMKELIRHFDPDSVSLMLDIGHATKDFREFPPDERAIRYLREFGDRITYLELKDWSAETDLNTPLGEGSADWVEIFSYLKDTGYKGWLTVEQNGNDGHSKGRLPRTSARISRDFLRKHLGV